MIHGALLRHTFRAQRTRLLLVAVALAVWGGILPLIYVSFGRDFQVLLESGLIPQVFVDLASSLGGGDIFSLPGTVALGVLHPFAVTLQAIFAVGFASAAVAGERQRGTLEVLLARPIGRRRLHRTLLLAAVVFVALSVAAQLAGSVVVAAALGVVGELDLGLLALLWLNVVLLFVAVASIGLAASVSFNRLAPALSVTLAVFLLGYLLEVLGTLWPDARGLQPFALFHYLQPADVLAGDADARSFAVLAAVALGATAAGLVVFPRRDLAAPT